MEDYKFNVGDTVVVLHKARIGKVVEARPCDTEGNNEYLVEYQDGDAVKFASFFMGWMLASPNDTVYSVVVEDYNDDGRGRLYCDTVARHIDHAKLRVAQLAEQWRKVVGEQTDRYETEQDELSFSAWRDGYYNSDHYNVVVNAKRLE